MPRTTAVRIASVRTDLGEQPAIVDPDRGVALVSHIAPELTGDLMSLLGAGTAPILAERARTARGDVFRPLDSVSFAPPYRTPAKIWGIGLNYRAHAGDLAEKVPEQPGSFIKASHTIAGPGDDIVLPDPDLAGRITSEAELGLIIGRYARNVAPEDALGYLYGVTPVLDQTAEDLVMANARYLTRSKNFPTFFSFGPVILPIEEVLGSFGSLDKIEVRTVRNGEAVHSDVVANMTFSPAELISYHSRIMPLFPGDIISPGTPGAAVISAGDTVRCEIPGIGTLENRVRVS
ncbi:MAG TPA: fumarylacetoacetate hydrolase family protein [Trebonia sp.]|jgi:2-keto-4-pentenoate hydratase/2-oxohepta-3-ene-1,7-dioic acid hydratase in catechol pathway